MGLKKRHAPKRFFGDGTTNRGLFDGHDLGSFHSAFENRRGGHEVAFGCFLMTEFLCAPNEDVGNPNKRLGMSFLSAFQRGDLGYDLVHMQNHVVF